MRLIFSSVFGLLQTKHVSFYLTNSIQIISSHTYIPVSQIGLEHTQATAVLSIIISIRYLV